MFEGIFNRLSDWVKLFHDGGPVMYPILICSIAALTITLERLWMLREKYVIVESVIKEAESLLAAGKVPEARAHLESSDTSLARIILAGIGRIGHSRAEIRESMENAGAKENFRLSQFINMLGNIATLTPLFGFLGTVYGMVVVFSVIAEKGIGHAGYVAGGIGVALITTAGGLTVGIPSFISYRYFQARVDNLMVKMEEKSEKFLDLIDDINRKQGTSA